MESTERSKEWRVQSGVKLRVESAERSKEGRAQSGYQSTGTRAQGSQAHRNEQYTGVNSTQGCIGHTKWLPQRGHTERRTTAQDTEYTKHRNTRG